MSFTGSLRRALSAAVVSSAVVLAGCGEGGGGEFTVTPPLPPSTQPLATRLSHRTAVGRP